MELSQGHPRDETYRLASRMVVLPEAVLLPAKMMVKGAAPRAAGPWPTQQLRVQGLHQAQEKAVARLAAVGAGTMWAWRGLLEMPARLALHSAAVGCLGASMTPLTAEALPLLADGTAGEGLRWPLGTPVPLHPHSPPQAQGCAGGMEWKVRCCYQCHLAKKALPGCQGRNVQGSCRHRVS